MNKAPLPPKPGSALYALHAIEPSAEDHWSADEGMSTPLGLNTVVYQTLTDAHEARDEWNKVNESVFWEVRRIGWYRPEGEAL